MELKIIIPDSKYNDFKQGFLKTNPKPKEAVGLSDEEFIIGWIQDQLYNHYKTGKITIARDTTIAEIDIKIYEE